MHYPQVTITGESEYLTLYNMDGSTSQVRTYPDLDRGPLRLQPIPWGKPDAKLGRVLCEHMVSANPPTVITWSTHQSRVRKLMRHYRLHDARIDDIDRLVLYQTKVNRLGGSP